MVLPSHFAVPSNPSCFKNVYLTGTYQQTTDGNG